MQDVKVHNKCYELQEQLERNIVLLKEKQTELDKALSRLSDQEPIDVDEAVTTTAPLYKQLVSIPFQVISINVSVHVFVTTYLSI